MPFRIALPAIISILLAFAIVSPASAGGEIVITQAKAYAGNVTPGDPPGFPVVITQPGAYVLESNLTVPAGNYGFAINAHNVDLDMNGFTLSGNGTATYGIFSSFGESRIHGGIINMFRFSGIYLRNNAWTIDNMQIVRNGGTGIDALGMRYIKIQDSLVSANGGYGIATGQDALISHDVVSNNTLIGIYCEKSSKIESSDVSSNLQHGIYIISGLVIGNTITENGNQGVNSLYYGVYSAGGLATGLANNMFVNNNVGVTTQTYSSIQIGSNGCRGNPCF